MTWAMFLKIMVPMVIFFSGVIVAMFTNNNKSHKDIWIQMNKNMLEITNRLTRIETKLESILNGRKP